MRLQQRQNALTLDDPASSVRRTATGLVRQTGGTRLLVTRYQPPHVPGCQPQQRGTGGNRSITGPDLRQNANTMQVALVHQHQTHANPQSNRTKAVGEEGHFYPAQCGQFYRAL
jgi:hypothetical protein